MRNTLRGYEMAFPARDSVQKNMLTPVSTARPNMCARVRAREGQALTVLPWGARVRRMDDALAARAEIIRLREALILVYRSSSPEMIRLIVEVALGENLLCSKGAASDPH